MLRPGSQTTHPISDGDCNDHRHDDRQHLRRQDHRREGDEGSPRRGLQEGDIKILQGGTDSWCRSSSSEALTRTRRGLADAAEQGKTLLAAWCPRTRRSGRLDHGPLRGRGEGHLSQRAGRRGAVARWQGQARHRRGPRHLQRRGAAGRGDRDASRRARQRSSGPRIGN